MISSNKNLKQQKTKETPHCTWERYDVYAGSEKEQANIITEHFKSMFTAVTVADEPTIIKPAEMRTPLTTEEIEKASKTKRASEKTD